MVPRGQEYEALGRVLLEARAAAKLSLRQVAANLGWHHSLIGKVEASERGLDVIEFVQLARALQVDPAKLLQRVIKAAEL